MVLGENVIYSKLMHCIEVRFSSFFFGGFITAIVVNPPERKLPPLCTGLKVQAIFGISSSFGPKPKSRFQSLTYPGLPQIQPQNGKALAKLGEEIKVNLSDLF